MKSRRVVGCVVATAKDESLNHIPLLLVRKIENGKEEGVIVAADSTRQAGNQELIYYIGKRPGRFEKTWRR